MLLAARDGARRLTQRWGLVVLVWAASLAFALVIAAPFALVLHDGVEHAAPGSMMYGFDFGFWEAWHDRQRGAAAEFGPALLGIGFLFRNLELLLSGQVPAGLPALAAGQPVEIAPEIAALGLLWLGAHWWLSGGVLASLRPARGGWSWRAASHAAGFYFGPMARLGMLSIAFVLLLFIAWAPLAAAVDAAALRIEDERWALGLVVLRHALLLGLLLVLHTITTQARVIVVAEDRRSALLAWASAVAFCARRARACVGLLALSTLAGVVLLACWHAIDLRIDVVGFRTQIPALLLMQALMLGRIGSRLFLQASLLSLYQRSADAATAGRG